MGQHDHRKFLVLNLSGINLMAGGFISVPVNFLANLISSVMRDIRIIMDEDNLDIERRLRCLIDTDAISDEEKIKIARKLLAIINDTQGREE